MSKILIASLSDPTRDPRIDRQVRALSAEHEVLFWGYGPTLVPGVRSCGFDAQAKLSGWRKKASHVLYGGRTAARIASFIMLKFPLLPVRTYVGIRLFAERHSLAARKLLRAVREERPDLVIVNDLQTLGVYRANAYGAATVYDAHEYSPGQYGEGRKAERQKAYSMALLSETLPGFSATMTVSEGIADEYSRVFGIARPEVILSAPSYEERLPRSRGNSRIRMVHHGVAGRLRRLEILIDMMRLLDDRFELDFYLLRSDQKYYEELAQRAAGFPQIRFLEPVPMPEIPAMLNRYDLGLAFFPPVTINLKYVLPNKFFEFVQGRIGIAIGPSPEMARYVRDFDLGVIADDFTAESLARSLSALTDGDIARFKQNAHRHAYELSAEPQMQRLRDIVSLALDKEPQGTSN